MLALTVANIKMLARNRQATFWAIFFPLLLVVVFGLVDIKGVGSGSIAVVDLDNSPRSEALREKLAEIGILKLEQATGGEGAGRQAVADRELDYLIVIPEDFGVTNGEASENRTGTVTLLYNSRDQERNQLVDGLVRTLVAETQPAAPSLRPLQAVTTEVVEVTQVEYFDQVLMGLIALGIMTNSIISIAVRVSTYRNQSILKRLLVTPLPIWKYFAAEISAHLLLAVVQVAIILVVGVFVFGASIHGNTVWIFLIALLAPWYS